MHPWGKIIGGVLGMMVAGPIGAIIGVAIGHRYDKRRRRQELGERLSGHDEAVAAAVTALGAKLAKIDGRVSEEEVLIFRRIFHVPQQDVRRIAELWREAARTPSGYEPYARHLAQLFAKRPEMLMQIVAGLREVVSADGPMRAAQRWALEDVARIFGLGRGWVDRPPPKRFDLRAGAISADSLTTAYFEMFDNRAADPDRQVFRAGGPAEGAGRDDLSARLAQPGARRLLVALAFASAAFAAHFSGLARALFPEAAWVLAVGAGAAAAWAAQALLSRPRVLPRAAERAATEAGVAVSEVASTVAEVRARIERLLQAASPFDAALRRRVETICTFAGQIAERLLEDPRAVARSRPFLLHYLDATGDVVQRYADLRARQGAEAQHGPVMEKMEPLLVDIEALFRAHYEQGLKGEALELDVSIDALQRMVRAEGRQASSERGSRT